MGRARQHQRLALVGCIAQTRTGSGCVALQSGLPVSQRGWQVRPKRTQALRPLHCHSGPARRATGGAHSRPKAGRCGHALPFARARPPPPAARGWLGHRAAAIALQGTVDVAQQALLGPQLQPCSVCAALRLWAGKSLSQSFAWWVRLSAGCLAQAHDTTSSFNMASRPSSNSIGAGKVQQPPAGPSMPRKNRYTAPPSCCAGL